MYALLKHELKYNAAFIIALIFLLLCYTTCVLLDFQLIPDKSFEIDYWGGILGFFNYIFLFIMWQFHIKERRIFTFALLPLNKFQQSIGRIIFIMLPALITAFYLVIIHLILLSKWHEETASVLGQTGFVYLIFTSIIISRDLWFSYENIIKKMIAVIFCVIVLGIIFFGLVFALPSIYTFFEPVLGNGFFYYKQLIIFVVAFALIRLSTVSLSQRVSYLS